jgi:hypothetical protein
MSKKSREIKVVLLGDSRIFFVNNKIRSWEEQYTFKIRG